MKSEGEVWLNCFRAWPWGCRAAASENVVEELHREQPPWVAVEAPQREEGLRGEVVELFLEDALLVEEVEQTLEHAPPEGPEGK